MSVVLGLHVGHDGTAALLVDGRIVAAVGEERLSRTKQHYGFPYLAIAGLGIYPPVYGGTSEIWGPTSRQGKYGSIIEAPKCLGIPPERQVCDCVLVNLSRNMALEKD